MNIKNAKYWLSEAGLICVALGFFFSSEIQVAMTVFGLGMSGAALYLAKRK